ncbi:MAG: phosphoribosylformylglycinamidine synthase subunit PurS [Deltaproteobacteria bacterium]|nr:MAG: phosphoribosylformylglycinamidine synthase subunit PurS [Deltaproteobacteria bacterium]TDJ19711.1 MAG: phosphoribosylformylglycinamidine synthase subunit PurS [Deltaproteobacteria bacterium]
MRALVHVTLKKDVLDPQGKAIQKASASLGYDAVKSVRQGKIFEIELDAAERQEAEAQLGELCEKLLANPVIEDYTIVSLES